jgi:adenylosuccinate synthase
VLDGLERIRICVGYQCGSDRLDSAPLGAEALAACEPIYEEMPGWRDSTVGVQRYEDLPANARAYLRRMETLADAPIDMISTGPDRVDTIVLRDPFTT